MHLCTQLQTTPKVVLFLRGAVHAAFIEMAASPEIRQEAVRRINAINKE